MVHPYSVIVDHEGTYEHLFDVYVFLKIFQPVWKEYSDKEVASKIIRFIVYGFSMESPYITPNGDSRKEFATIFDKLELDKKLYKDVVLLENVKVNEACVKWMEFQDNAQLEFLYTLKMSYAQQQSASISPLKKADLTNIDYDQKHKCIEHMRDLREWIKVAEQELIQNDPKLKDKYKILGVDNSKKNSKNKGMESFLKEDL